jgi:PadR family transcriptional regulator PadR
VSTERLPGGFEIPVFPGGIAEARLPKNLLTPWILLLLKQWRAHGYVLLQQLETMGFPGVDHATLYKELRGMEANGLITSSWETASAGPAKRVYGITETGEEMLRGWANVVAGYQRMLGGFFEMYAQLFNLSGSGQSAPSSPGTNQAATPEDLPDNNSGQ